MYVFKFVIASILLEEHLGTYVLSEVSRKEHLFRDTKFSLEKLCHG